MKKPLRNLLPLVQFEGELLTYEVVRKTFGWRDNATIRRYIGLGLLTRVRIGARSKDCRITTASVASLRDHLNKMIADAEYTEKCHTAMMRESKGLPQPKSDEVLISAESVINHYNEGRQRELPDPTPDAGETYTAAPVRKVQRVGFSRVRGI